MVFVKSEKYETKDFRGLISFFEKNNKGKGLGLVTLKSYITIGIVQDEVSTILISSVCLNKNITDNITHSIKSISKAKVVAKNNTFNKEILEKNGPLENDEMYLLRTHSEIGYRILSVINEMSESANIILAHHERWDGTGYPKGLKGDEIPLLSRIVVIADAFAAMTNPSFYKKTMTFEEALAELERCSGTQFDPILGRTFVGRIREQIKNQKT